MHLQINAKLFLILSARIFITVSTQEVVWTFPCIFFNFLWFNLSVWFTVWVCNWLQVCLAEWMMSVCSLRELIGSILQAISHKAGLSHFTWLIIIMAASSLSLAITKHCIKGVFDWPAEPGSFSGQRLQFLFLPDQMQMKWLHSHEWKLQGSCWPKSIEAIKKVKMMVT